MSDVNVYEVKRWLFSDESECVAWRHAPENQKRVGEFANFLAGVPGGVSLHVTQTRLNDEKERIQARENAKNAQAQRVDELRELKFKEVAAFGVTREAFDLQWPQIMRDLMTRGVLDSEYSRLTNVKRSQAAKTF